MPSHFIPKIVEDIIFYYYSKLIIAPSAGFEGNFKFIIDTYKRLKSGEIRISDYERELIHIANTLNICAFCGAKNSKNKIIHVVPRNIGVDPGMHNLVYTCESCAKSKDEKDLIEWWCSELKRDRDEIPRVPLGLYLKIAYELHKLNFSLKKPCKSIGDLLKILEK